LKEPLVQLARRARDSAVLWSWGMNALRVGATLLLLPLLLRRLDAAELGMHYLLTGIMVLAPLLDFGFGNAIWRAVAHAQAGGRELNAEGLEDPPAAESLPNTPLQWQLLQAARQTYARLAWWAAALLAVGGSAVVAYRVAELPAPHLAWVAWAITWVAAVAEVRAGWWGVFLLGLNRPRDFARANFAGYAVRLALGAALLWAGAGLLAVPGAALVGVGLQRWLARRECLRQLAGAEPAVDPGVVRTVAARLWPNARRIGVVALSSFLGTQSLLLISLAGFGLAATAQFGLSLQLMSVSQSMAAVWLQVKWPELARRQSQGDLAGLRALMRGRVWLALGTCAVLAGGAVLLAPPLLAWFAPDKAVLPPGWLAVMAMTALLDLHLSCWGALLFAGNQVPYQWPVVFGNLATLALAAVLAASALGLMGLALAPLLVGLAYNHWHWPRVGAARLGTTWTELMCSRRVA
jgi:hypothetical protein